MKQPKQFKKIDWFSWVLDDDKKLAIPVGPRFQADVPKWNGPPQRKFPHKTFNKSDSSKWLGTLICSSNDTTPETERGVVGLGRPHHCDCYHPGSINCVKRHINNKIANMKKDLGAAFQIWKFDEMGEEVAKLWKHSEQQKFARIVNTNPVSEGNNFIKHALKCFPSKSGNVIVSYYFNVYLPRRICINTRSGCTSVDTDNEEDKTTPCSKRSLKRSRVDGIGSTSKTVKVGYLAGRR